jgi:hypothetical protein
MAMVGFSTMSTEEIKRAQSSAARVLMKDEALAPPPRLGEHTAEIVAWLDRVSPCG